MQNQGGLVVVGTRAVGIDFLNATASERRELLHDGPVDKDPKATAAHRTVFERPAIDHNLAGLVCGSLERRG